MEGTLPATTSSHIAKYIKSRSSHGHDAVPDDGGRAADLQVQCRVSVPGRSIRSRIGRNRAPHPPPTKKNWYKDIRPRWDRLKANRPRESDHAVKDMVFALKHRVCGNEKLVKVYLCGSSFPGDTLLSYDNYASRPIRTTPKKKCSRMP